MKCIENIKTRKCITKKDGHERNCKEMKGYGRNVGQCIQIYEISDKTEQHNSCATNRNNTKNRSHSKLLCLITGPQRFFFFKTMWNPHRATWATIVRSRQYTIYSWSKKTDYSMVQTFCLKCVLVLGFLQKNTESNPFGYDLGNFVYNSIWFNMVYNIEKHWWK